MINPYAAEAITNILTGLDTFNECSYRSHEHKAGFRLALRLMAEQTGARFVSVNDPRPELSPEVIDITPYQVR